MDNQLQIQLSQAFASYRAEELRGDIFRLFTQPEYFHSLENGHPHIIEGGRGTGKTTVLKCLSYEGRYEIQKGSNVLEWPYYGLYFRVNSARSSSFSGDDRSQDEWIRFFCHYINLNICYLLTEFLKWFTANVSSNLDFSDDSISKICRSLHIKASEDLDDLSNNIYDAFIDFESDLNNPQEKIRLSTLGQPIDLYFESVSKLPHFSRKNFFILIDEFENYSDWQQRVVNTLIKQSSDKPYTFKIGVREMGLKDRSTLVGTEILSTPSDYTRIDVGFGAIEDSYKKFAYNVCNARLNLIDKRYCKIRDVKDLLPTLSDEEEAIILGVDSYVSELLPYFKDEGLSNLMLAVIKLFHESKGESSYTDISKNFSKNQSKWNTRYSNYAHSILFILRKKKSGIRKYYCGWDTFVYLSGGNIRYLLELLDRSIVEDTSADDTIIEKPISYKKQTEAAIHIAEKNLRDLEGLSGFGNQLTRLVLSLGRVFGLIAENPDTQAPEKNQFHFSNHGLSDRTQNVVKNAVMHLALSRSIGTKLSGHGDIRDFDYMLHPIFSPFFNYSHRRKRKFMISQEEFLSLIDNPSNAILRLSKQPDEERGLNKSRGLFD